MIYVNKADPSTLSATDNLFQTHFWGKIKDLSGQTPVYFNVIFKNNEQSDEINFSLLVLLRKTNGIPYAYIPKSPPLSISKDKQSQILEELALALQKELPKDIVFLRYDLLWSSFEQPENLRPELLELKMNYGTQTHNLRKAFRNFLPADSVVINLRLPPERLLMNMRQQTRNSIRRAYKEKIDFLIYDCSSPKLFEELKKWHEIYVNTAQRKGFYFEKYEYFESIFLTEREFSVKQKPFCREKDIIPMNATVPPPHFYLFTAYKDNVLLSGLILAICENNAYYMYAASSLEKRECMPNYGLQWEVIRFARSKGCTQYDLMGIPPNDDKENPMAGLYIFKTGFGGRNIHFEGTWDFPYNAEKYKEFQLSEQFSK